MPTVITQTKINAVGTIVFPNNNNTLLLVPKQPASFFNNYREQPYHELLFRDIMSYLMNEVLPGCRTDCFNVLAMPEERDDQIIDKLSKHLNTFNYVLVVFVKYRCESIKFTGIDKAYRTFLYLQKAVSLVL